MNSPSTLSLSDLRAQADKWPGGRTVIFKWLVNHDLIPPMMEPPSKRVVVRLGGDPDAIATDYIAASAAEWDSWGKTDPRDFVSALETEYGQRYDAVSEVLSSLGRE